MLGSGRPSRLSSIRFGAFVRGPRRRTTSRTSGEACRQRDDIADFRSAGTLATPPHGHPTQLLAAMASMLDGVSTAVDFVADPADAPAFVEARLAEGADYLEIVIDDGAVHGADLPVLTPETVAALTDSAHEHGLRVIAHATTAAEVKIALDAGIDVTPFVPTHGAGLHRELELLVEAGIGPKQALAAATSVPAQHFGLQDRGRIAAGLRADVVLLEGDPTLDITTSAHIVEAWRRGIRQQRDFR